MKNVIKRIKSIKLLNVKLENQLNDPTYMHCNIDYRLNSDFFEHNLIIFCL